MNRAASTALTTHTAAGSALQRFTAMEKKSGSWQNLEPRCRAYITFFRAADTPRRTKLQLGHFLLEGIRPKREGFPKEFVAEFARDLVQAVLD